MKYLMTTAALCLSLMTVQAQSERTAPMAATSHNCLTTTTDKDWAGLGLSAEQTAKVKEVQMECMKVSDKLKADNMDSKNSPMLDKYEGKVKEVLTPAQYEKWVKECSTHAAIKKDEVQRAAPAEDNN